MKVCIFGDSITWGANDFERGGWVERLKMHYLKNENGINIYNLGIDGDNTDKLLKRLGTEAALREPALIIFAIGINDSQYIKTKDNHRVDLEKFEGNIYKLIEIAQKFTGMIIFSGLTRVDELKTMPIPWDISKYYDNESIKKYDAIITKICREKRLEYVDMKEVIEFTDLEDGLHPNSCGHNKMYAKVREVIDLYLTDIKK